MSTPVVTPDCCNDMVILNAISDSAQHLHNNIADGTRAEIKEVSDASRSILKDVADNSRAVLRETSDGTRFVSKEVSDRAHLIEDELCDSTRDIIREINRRGAEERASFERQNLSLKEQVENWGYRSVSSTEHGVQKNLIAFKEQLLELEKAKQVLERQAADNRYSIERQAAENACGIKLLQEKSLLESLRHMDKLAADSAREMAECCCELKTLVISKADETDRLILKLEDQRTKEELTDAKNEILALRLRAPLPLPPA